MCGLVYRPYTLAKVKIKTKRVALLQARLDIPEEAEVLVAAWESGNLIKKTLDSVAFIEELQTLVGRWIPHNHIRQVQGKAIYMEKRCEKKRKPRATFRFRGELDRCAAR